MATSPLRGPLLIATDGSSVTGPPSGRRGRGFSTGFGWITTDGRWGLGACPIPANVNGTSPALVAELRAIWHAVDQLWPGETPTLLVDSAGALKYLDIWASGDLRLPPGYLGSQQRRPTLERLARHIRDNHASIAWRPVRGHSGHLLNEAADSLAKIGREWAAGRCEKQQAAERGARLVQGFLADHRLAELAAATPVPRQPTPHRVYSRTPS
jgi:ribonuclease HI